MLIFFKLSQDDDNILNIPNQQVPYINFQNEFYDV